MRNCPLHVESTCPLTLLRRVLAERGEVTLKRSDLEGFLGLTEFGTGTVHLEQRQNDGEWRATLAHELMHLLRGPVPERLAEHEEMRVRHEVARHLIPLGPVLASTGITFDPEVMQEFAARSGFDHGTVQDAIDPATMPIPWVLPREEGAA